MRNKTAESCSRKMSGAELVEGVGGGRSQKRHWSCWDASTSWENWRRKGIEQGILREWEPSGAESGFAVATDGSSFCSCSPSMAYDVDEAMSMSSRKSPSMNKERDWWSADLEGEMEKLQVEGNFSVAEGGSTMI